MKVLFLSKDAVFPLDSGGKIRTYHLLKELNKKFEMDIISLICPGEEKYIPDMQKLCKNFIYLKGKKFEKKGIMFYFRVLKNIFSFYPYTMMNDSNRALKKKINNIANNYDLLICDFLFPSLNCVEVKIPKILFQHNVEFTIPKGNFENTNWIKKLMWYLQYVKTKRIEKIITNKFDYVVCVSKKDAETCSKAFNIKNVDYIDLGVDVKEYDRKRTKSEENSLIFTGVMDWNPNVDAVKYFHNKIFPKLQNFKFYAVGRNPEASLKKLNRENFVIIGGVEDIKPYLFRGKIYVAPLRIGSGSKIKIFEAMASKIPVVSTTKGVEGLPVTNLVNVFICDAPNEFADAVIRLNNDKKLYNKIVNNAYNLVKEKYSWEKVSQRFIKLAENCLSKQEN